MALTVIKHGPRLGGGSSQLGEVGLWVGGEIGSSGVAALRSFIATTKAEVCLLRGVRARVLLCACGSIQLGIHFLIQLEKHEQGWREGDVGIPQKPTSALLSDFLAVIAHKPDRSRWCA